MGMKESVKEFLENAYSLITHEEDWEDASISSVPI